VHNHYAGDDAFADLAREATAHPELLEFMEKVNLQNAQVVAPLVA